MLREKHSHNLQQFLCLFCIPRRAVQYNGTEDKKNNKKNNKVSVQNKNPFFMAVQELSVALRFMKRVSISYLK